MRFYVKRNGDDKVVEEAKIVKEIEADTRLVYEDRLVSTLWAELEGEGEGTWFVTYDTREDAEDSIKQYYRKMLACNMEL